MIRLGHRARPQAKDVAVGEDVLQLLGPGAWTSGAIYPPRLLRNVLGGDSTTAAWPRARHAIRILEVAHRKRWLLDLASYAADVEKERRTRAAEFAEEPTIQKKYWEW